MIRCFARTSGQIEKNRIDGVRQRKRMSESCTPSKMLNRTCYWYNIAADNILQAYRLNASHSVFDWHQLIYHLLPLFSQMFWFVQAEKHHFTDREKIKIWSTRWQEASSACHTLISFRRGYEKREWNRRWNRKSRMFSFNLWKIKKLQNWVQTEQQYGGRKEERQIEKVSRVGKTSVDSRPYNGCILRIHVECSSSHSKVCNGTSFRLFKRSFSFLI